MLVRWFDGGLYRVLENIEANSTTNYWGMYIEYGGYLGNIDKNDASCR